MGIGESRSKSGTTRVSGSAWAGTWPGLRIPGLAYPTYRRTPGSAGVWALAFPLTTPQQEGNGGRTCGGSGIAGWVIHRDAIDDVSTAILGKGQDPAPAQGTVILGHTAVAHISPGFFAFSDASNHFLASAGSLDNL